MRDKRQYARTSSHASATISHPNFSYTAKVIDISAGGMAVDLSNHTRPPVGTIVQVLIKRPTGKLNHEPHDMRVVHVQQNGIVGLTFV